MSRRVSSLDKTTVGIERDISSQYDNVKVVATNITDVSTVASSITSINNINDNLAEILSAGESAAAFVGFEERYLGVKTEDPTTDNVGDPLVSGALYYSSTLQEFRVWNNNTWNSVSYADLSAYGVTASVDEVNYIEGVISPVQTQLDTKIGSIVEDSSPLLGGTLNAGGNSIIGIDSLVADSVQLSGGIGTQGLISWNVDEETLDVILNGATLQVGQEVHYHVRNNTASDIPDGTPVSVSGTLGASGRLTVVPFIADGSIPAKYFIGLTTETIAAGDDGKVTHFGKIRGINTSIFPEGAILYPSATESGQLTPDRPIADGTIALPCVFVVSSTNNGTLFVRVNGMDENAFASAAQGDLADSAIQPGDSISALNNDLGYLTSFVEADPVFTASAAAAITLTDTANWNTAYSWGDHSVAGYLTEYAVTEMDVTQHQAALSITESQISDLDHDAVKLQGISLDATVGTPADGSILVYRSLGSDWVLEEKPISGANPAIEDVVGITITSAADNDILAYDTATSTWVNQSAIEAGLSPSSHNHDGIYQPVGNYVTTTSIQALHATDALSIVGNTLYLNKADGTNETVDLSLYLDDTNLARIVSGVYDAGTTSLVFTRDDASTFSVDASMFFDDTNLVTSVNGQTGTVTITTASIGAEPADSTILKDADIGVTVQGYDANIVSDADYVHTDNNYTTTEKSKLAGIEDGADVTDATNVAAAGALMDSEVTSLSGIKTLTVPDNTTVSTFGASLVDDIDAATARSTLGVDVAGTDNSTDVTLAGTGTYLSIVGQVITVDPITESDISDFGTYLTDITGESIVTLSDVYSSMTPTDGQVLTYDTTNGWQAESIPSINSLGDISDVTITTVGLGEVLTWNGTAWVNNTLSEAGISAASHTHTISAITDFTDNSTNWDIAYGWGNHASAGYLTAITGESIESLSDVTTMTPTNGQVLTWDGTNSYWYAADAQGGGSTGLNTFTDNEFTATADQTTFTVDYTVGSVEVFLNGILLGSADYTATNGTSVVLGTGASLNDLVTVRVYDFADSADFFNDVTFTGSITEEVYIGGTPTAIDASLGTVQYWGLSSNATPTDALSSGESITVLIQDGTDYTITWPTMTWVNNGGLAPTLATSGYTVVALWKGSTVLFGALVGDGS